MYVLVAAVCLVGALCLFDLVLSLGMIRRLREQTTELAALRSSAHPHGDEQLAPGAEVGGFVATTITGGVVTRDTVLTGPTVVGLFLVGCGPCAALLPEFARYAADTDQPVLAVVVGDPGEADALVESLAPVADVILDGPAGPVAAAFAATSYPQVFHVDGGRVVTSGRALDALPPLTAVRAGRS